MIQPRLRRSLPCLVLAAACAAGLLATTPVSAQVGPTPAEAARYSGLHAAAHRGDTAQIDRLAAARTDVNARDTHGRTPLHVATFARQRGAIRALVKAGADLHLLESDRYDGASARLTTSRYDGTALIAAAHLGHDGVVRQLIAAGAPLDHVNNLHWTAVIESIVLGNGGPHHQATLKALVQAGASLQLTDRQGNTPLQLARTRGYDEMVRMLEAAGAK
jgi:uncharacterized protein